MSLITPSILLKEIKKVIEEATKDMKLGDEERAPNIYVGYPPMKKTKLPIVPPSPSVTITTPNNQILNNIDDDSIYPCVIVRYLNSEDTDNNGVETASTDITLIFGVKSSDEQGYLDVMHLSEIVRQTLLKKGIIGGAAEIQKPLSMNIYDDQAFPFWYGDAMTKWTIPTIIREADNLDF